MPAGGIKDTLPPQVINSIPANYSVNFDGKTIEIEFNEYIKLDKINQQALISPPLEKNPEYRIKGKKLQVRFDEELKPETTYTIFFGNAIVDLTESNPLAAHTFVFSTGPVLDSMAFRGKVHFAFEDIAAEEVFVFLYRIEEDTIPVDSLPFLKKPYYVSRTDKKGNFRFRNLRNEPYLMFALEDRNSNFKYDKGGEAIAFSNEIVKPEFLEIIQDPIFEELDSPPTDSMDHQHDDHDQGFDRQRDSLAYVAKVRSDSLSFDKLKPYTLNLFYEPDSTQKLLRAEVVKKGQLRFAFRYPAPDVSVEPMIQLPDTLGLLKMYTPKKDTLLWFYRDSVLDTIPISIKYDTLIDDTLRMAMSPKVSLAARKNQKKKAEGPGLNFTSKVMSRKLDIGKQLTLTFPEPVIRFQMRDSSRYIAAGDTIYNQVSFVKSDSLGLHYTLDVPAFEAEKDYSVLIPDSVFFGLSGLTNDTIAIDFKVPAISDYGTLVLDLIPETDFPVLIQLLTPKGDVVEQRTIRGSQKLKYELMKPAKFIVKAIIDENSNGRWDTGDLVNKKQPERVFFMDKELEIRANWDLEEEWVIGASEDSSGEKK